MARRGRLRKTPRKRQEINHNGSGRRRRDGLRSDGTDLTSDGRPVWMVRHHLDWTLAYSYYSRLDRHQRQSPNLLQLAATEVGVVPTVIAGGIHFPNLWALAALAAVID